ncbi:MAG TPA: DUF1697 domain-containing protein [Pyrinomonadaceae bacterium]|nr:DUF1697 domain-containing protein [Pyrinomonadaceae bacterium]
MPKYVAFLRAINVGSHTVKMDHLRKLFESLNFSNVETFIASGNVIFDSPARNTGTLEKKIEAHLQGVLGYRVATFIRTLAELAKVSQYKPFPDSDLTADGNTLYVGFMAAAPVNNASQNLSDRVNSMKDFKIHGREVYWLHRKRSDSVFPGAQIEKTLGVETTLRNINTVKRILAKYS